jgi:hypothetical protein
VVNEPCAEKQSALHRRKGFSPVLAVWKSSCTGTETTAEPTVVNKTNKATVAKDAYLSGRSQGLMEEICEIDEKIDSIDTFSGLSPADSAPSTQFFRAIACAGSVYILSNALIAPVRRCRLD